MHRLLIIADDLSGAADCAAACLQSGLTASVSFGNAHHEFQTDVLAIDCDTRHLEPEAAARRVAHIVSRHLPDDRLFLFKKLDSTLRGHVASELAAMLSVHRSSHSGHPPAVAVLAPAFPSAGRTTIDGHQLVHGQPLHESETWKHHRSLTPTHLPTMLSLAGLRNTSLPLNDIRAGEHSLAAAMKAVAATIDVLVCDAETDDDLRTIAHASLALDRPTLWAGSAGLAYHLPRLALQQVIHTRSQTVPATLSTVSTGPTLIVIGSMSSVARQQVGVLTLGADVSQLAIPPAVLTAGQQSLQWSTYANRLAAMLRSGQDVVLTLEDGARLSPGEGRRLSSALGTMTLPCADSVGALVASGGETARAILDAWGVTGLRLINELEPGLPFSVTENWRRPLPVLTKAGAFGSPQALLHCWQFLQTIRPTTERSDAEKRKITP